VIGNVETAYAHLLCRGWVQAGQQLHCNRATAAANITPGWARRRLSRHAQLLNPLGRVGISFPPGPPIRAVSRREGYSSVGVPRSNLVFQITFTNQDPQGSRSLSGHDCARVQRCQVSGGGEHEGHAEGGGRSSIIPYTSSTGSTEGQRIIAYKLDAELRGARREDDLYFALAPPSGRREQHQEDFSRSSWHLRPDWTLRRRHAVRPDDPTCRNRNRCSRLTSSLPAHGPP